MGLLLFHMGLLYIPHGSTVGVAETPAILVQAVRLEQIEHTIFVLSSLFSLLSPLFSLLSPLSSLLSPLSSLLSSLFSLLSPLFRIGSA